jgi:hypothetical protein
MFIVTYMNRIASFCQRLNAAVPNDRFFDNLKGEGGVEGEVASRPPVAAVVEGDGKERKVE